MRVDIAGLVIEIENPQIQEIHESFEPFLSEEVPEYRIQYQAADVLDIEEAKLLYHGDCFDIPVGRENERLFFELATPERYYARGIYDWENKVASITYLEEGKKHLDTIRNAFFHIGFEQLLMQEKRMVLHSCLVKSQYGGILFSGNSGIGKSTQGDLWVKYENARIINGDRSIIRKGGSSWLAYGSPYAGSSRYYVNESEKVCCIVMLKQEKICRIRRMTVGEAFRTVFPQITVNTWDAEFVNKAVLLVEELVSTVPVFELACTPDVNAVEILKKELADLEGEMEKEL